MTKLGNVLRPHKDLTPVDDPKSAKLISVKLHGLGATQRLLGDGKAPAPFLGNRARAGQFVFSRIWARRGAMALIPPHLDGAVVTNEFPLFDIVTERLNPQYLMYYVQTTGFLRRLEQISAGASGQNRVKVAAFLELPITLPPLAEQNRIATILDEADALRAKQQRLRSALNALNKSVFYAMFGDPDDAESIASFGEIATLTAGRNLVAPDPTIDSRFRVLKISAVTSGEFKPYESKPLPVSYVPPPDHIIRPGDLLMSRANTAELVGATALAVDPPANIALPDKIWRVTWRDAKSVPVYYLALLNTTAIRRRLSGLASGTGGSMKNIAKANLERMPVPVTSISKQREYAERVHFITAQKLTASRQIAALSELFSSLQDRAFRGEL